MKTKLMPLLVSATCLWLCDIHTHEVQATDVTSDSEVLLRSEFDSSKPGRALLVQQKGTLASAELCLDRCDYFEWKGSAHDVEAWDFMVLFEYQAGSAASTEAFKEAVAPSIPNIVARAEPYCSRGSDSRTDFKCAWARFAARKSMKVGIATYDEGLRCFAWRDLRTMNWPKKSKCVPITRTPWS